MHLKLVFDHYFKIEMVKVTCMILVLINTYPLRTPRTRFNIKKEPTTISGIKKTQLNTVPRASFV